LKNWGVEKWEFARIARNRFMAWDCCALTARKTLQ